MTEEFAKLMADYVRTAEVNTAYAASLMISIFTKVNNPGTLFLAAFDGDKLVGFLWAQPAWVFGEPYLRVSEIYATVNSLGMEMFREAKDFAKRDGFKAIKGLVSRDKALAMQRLFSAKEEAVLITVEL